MDSNDTIQQIHELQRLRTQKRFWQWGISLALLGVVLICMLKVRNAIYGLTQPGPTQQVFVTDLSSRLEQNVFPTVQDMGMQAIREVDYQAEISKLNARTPELAQASMEQMKLLSDNLSVRGKKVFETTLQSALKQRESKIRALFPDATDEQVANCLTNLTNEAGMQIADINDALFARHKKALDGIVEHITYIQHQEAPNVKQDPPTWAMALLIFDIAREDLRGLEPAAIKVEHTSNKTKSATPKAKEVRS